LVFAIGAVSADLSVVSREDGTVRRRFSEHIDQLAVELSMELGKALVVRYDDRVGLRWAGLYEGGEAVREFGEDDELWVPLGEDGEPVVDGLQLKYSELDPDEEYATSVNAIEAGLLAFGRGSWQDLAPIIRGEMELEFLPTANNPSS